MTSIGSIILYKLNKNPKITVRSFENIHLRCPLNVLFNICFVQNAVGWTNPGWVLQLSKILWLFRGEECSLCPLLYHFITCLLVQAAALLNMNATYVSKLQVKKFDELSGRKLCHDSQEFFFPRLEPELSYWGWDIKHLLAECPFIFVLKAAS